MVRTSPTLSPIARWSVVGISLIAAIGFALAVQGGDWWSLGELTVGPSGQHNCFGGQCRAGGLTALGGGGLWERSGTAAAAAGMIALITLVVLAAGTAAGRVPRLAAKTVISAAVTAGVASAVFIAKFPGIPGASIGRGLVCYVGAVAGAFVAAAILLRARVRPATVA